MRLSALVAVVAALLPALPGGAATIHLKPGATGDGSGSSWSNACTTFGDAVAKLNYAEDGSELRIAQGVYSLESEQTVTVADFAIRGGYRAQSDEDEVRDPAEYQSILNGYGSNAQTWTQFDPVADTKTHLSDRVIVDGKIRYPEETGDNAPNEYAFFYRRNDTWGYTANLLTVAGTAGGEVSGLVLTGCRGNKSTAIVISAGGPGTVISNCLFTANGYAGAVSVGQTTVPSRVSDCVFKFNIGTANNASGVLFSGAGVLENSTFDGNYVNDGFQVCLVDFGGAGGVVSNCVFRRTFYHATDNNRAVSYNGAAAVFRPKNSSPRIYDCVIDNTFTKTDRKNSYPAPIVNGRSGLFSGLVVSNNISLTYLTAGRSYSVYSDPCNGANGAIWTNCLFAGNTLRIVGKTTTSCADGDVAVGTLSNAKDGYALKVFDTVFDSNRIELPQDAEALSGLNVVRCRGVISQGIAGTAASQVTVNHCTFIGPAETGVPDIAQFGVAHTKPFALQNSLFLLSDDSRYSTPFLVQRPVYGNKAMFAPLNVTIQNQTTQPSDEYAVAGLASDKVPLNAAYEPLARTPGLLTTTDGRPRGARPLASGVAGKKTLTVRREPLEGGTISAGGTQAVAVGDEITAVTAEPVGGSGFAGWYYDGESEPVSSALTLSGQTLDDDRVVIAKFVTRPVRVVYDLDKKGTFDATGSDRHAIITNAGLDFPACDTSFSVADGWIFVNWHETPAKVPSDADEIVVSAKIVTKGLRTVFLTPTGAGRKDGTSWANAYDSLQKAIDDAAICRGEVWAGQGVYALPVSVDMRSNVAVRGGFAGTESAASESDPAACETIFTGDLALDDHWATNDVKVFNVFVGGKVALPAGDGDDPDVIWRHVYATAPTDVGFTDANAAEPLTNVCFSGVTFACFNQKAVGLGAGTDARFEGCRFVANGNDDVLKADYLSLASAGRVSLADCRFTGNCAAVRLSAGKSVTNSVSGCTFEHARSKFSTCGLSVGGSAFTLVTNCVFRRNNAVGNFYYSAPASALGVERSVDANVRVVDTVFEKNRSEGTAIATAMIRNGHNVVSFDHCRFSGNRYCSVAAMPIGYNMEYLPGSAGISSLSDRSLTVRDTVFETNAVSVKFPAAEVAKLTNNYASAIGVGWTASLRILNCAFVGNVAKDESEGVLPYPVGTLSTGHDSRNAALAVVNSLFRDNEVVSARDSAEIALVGSAAETVTLINDVLWNPDAKYRPFAFDTAVTPQLACCIVRNFDHTVFADADEHSYLEKVAEAAPVFSRHCRYRLAGSSPGERGGMRIYASQEGKWYFKDEVNSPEKPWRDVANRTSRAAAVVGLGDIPLPDMEGVSRERRVSYGPLAADIAGMVLILR